MPSFVWIGETRVNADHIVSIEPKPGDRPAPQLLVRLIDGRALECSEGEDLDELNGLIIPAPPGLVMVEALAPSPNATDRAVDYVSTTVIAFRLVRNDPLIPIGLDGEAGFGNQTVVIQPDGQCVGWYDTWDSLDAFKRAQQAIADAVEPDVPNEAAATVTQLPTAAVGQGAEPSPKRDTKRSASTPLDELRATILAAPIEALHPGAPWDPELSSEEVIAEVRDANPQLHASGYGYQRSFGWKWGPTGLADERAAMTKDGRIEEFERSIRFLSYAARDHRTRSVNERRSSYSWKHVAERVMGDYVSNGMLIAAAYALGFTVKTLSDSPNVYINLGEAAAALDPQNGL